VLTVQSKLGRKPAPSSLNRYLSTYLPPSSELCRSYLPTYLPTFLLHNPFVSFYPFLKQTDFGWLGPEQNQIWPIRYLCHHR
jgi:hypothetical protein